MVFKPNFCGRALPWKYGDVSVNLLCFLLSPRGQDGTLGVTPSNHGCQEVLRRQNGDRIMKRCSAAGYDSVAFWGVRPHPTTKKQCENFDHRFRREARTLRSYCLISASHQSPTGTPLL